MVIFVRALVLGDETVFLGKQSPQYALHLGQGERRDRHGDGWLDGFCGILLGADSHEDRWMGCMGLGQCWDCGDRGPVRIRDEHDSLPLLIREVPP